MASLLEEARKRRKESAASAQGSNTSRYSLLEEAKKRKYGSSYQSTEDRVGKLLKQNESIMGQFSNRSRTANSGSDLAGWRNETYKQSQAFQQEASSLLEELNKSGNKALASSASKAISDALKQQQSAVAYITRMLGDEAKAALPSIIREQTNADPRLGADSVMNARYVAPEKTEAPQKIGGSTYMPDLIGRPVEDFWRETNRELDTMRSQKLANQYKDASYSDMMTASKTAENSFDKAWLAQNAISHGTVEEFQQTYDEASAKRKAVEEIENILKSIGSGGDEEDQRIRQRADKRAQLLGYESADAAVRDMENLNRAVWDAEGNLKFGNLQAREDYGLRTGSLDDEIRSMESVLEIRNRMALGDAEKTQAYQHQADAAAQHLGFAKADDIDTALHSISDDMTEQEKLDYLYAVRTMGAEAAKDYLDRIQYAINERKMNERMWKVGLHADSGGAFKQIGLVLASFGADMVGGIGAVEVTLQNVNRFLSGEYRPVDYNRWTMAPTNFAKIVHGSHAKTLAEAGTIQLDEAKNPIAAKIFNGKGLADVYRLGTSMADSGVTMALSTALGPAATGLLGASAASSTMLQVAENGGTDEQVLIMGMLAGAAEIVFERYELDSLWKIWETDGRVVQDLLKTAVTEGVGEGATSVANLLADCIVMGDRSEIERRADELVTSKGLSRTDAMRDAITEQVISIGWDFVGGALSGALMGGIQSGTKHVVNSIDQSNVERSVAEMQSGSAEQVRSLLNMAAKADPTSQAVKNVQSKLQSGTQITPKDIRNLNKVLDNVKPAQTVTEPVPQEAEQKEFVSDYNPIPVPEGDATEVMQKISEAEDPFFWARGYEQERVQPEAQKQDTVATKEAEPVETNGKIKASREGFSVSDTRKTSYDGGDVKVKRIAEPVKGEMMLELEDGRTVKASDVAFANDGEAAIYEAAASLGVDSDIANLVVRTYLDQPGGVDAEDYALGAADVFTSGKHNLDISDNSFGSMLTPVQRNSLYVLGQRFGKREAATAQTAVMKKRMGQRFQTAKGLVKYDGDMDALTENQRTQLNALKVLAKATGTKIEVFESEVDEEGRRQGANGWYDTDTGTIHIDLYAGADGSGTMMFTLAHELTHHIKQWSPAKYKELADYLVEQYKGKNISVDDLITAQIQKAQRNNRNISRDEAFEEVVADSMEAMLVDGRVAERLAELREKDRSLWQEIKNFISKLAKKIHELYRDLKPDSAEGRYVAEMGKAIKRMQDMFAEALVDASGNFNAAENVGLNVDMKTESVAPSVVFSERTWSESEYVKERDKAAEEIAKAIGVTPQKAKDYIDSVNSIANMIAIDRTRLDYFSSPGRSSFVSNVEYGGSFDFSTLCKKRRLLTGTFTAIQKALPNTALTADEILDIRNRMKEANLEVSCGLCYVEGSRANMGQFAKEFLKLYKQYYPDSWQPNMADVNTPDGIEWVRINHPEVYEQYEYFWNHYGTLKPGDKNLFASQQKPKLYQLHTEYKGEILEKFKIDDNVEEKNLNGGIRLQSFSDFEIVHLIDCMQIIMDMSRVGLAGQAYTKVPDFAWALGDTGLKINLSLIAKGVDADGKLIFDDVEGMPIDEAVKLRNTYSQNVGTILVAFTDDQLMAAMADDRVDFIIPFHRSQWKKSQYSAMGLPAKTKDYTFMQNEKFIKPQYHEYRGRMVKDKATNYMPNEYWDFSKSGKENAEAYLEMCARNNKRPKFYKLLQNNGDGSYSLKPDGSTDGYWKLLIDFKMYDNNGNGSPQMPVRPDFNMDEATRMLNDYKGGHSNFPVAQGIVDEFVQEYKDSHKGVKYSIRGFSEQVDKVKNNTHDPMNHVYMGQTPFAIATVLDLPKLPMLITAQHIYSMAVSKEQAKNENRFKSRNNYHNLGWDTVKNLPEYISKPALLIKSNTDPNDATFVVVTAQPDNAGKPIIAVIKPNGKGNYFNIELPTNFVLSGYGKDGFHGYVAKAKNENRILYANKNSQKNKNTPSVQFADNILSSDYSESLAYFKEIVKNTFAGTVFEHSGLPKFSDRDTESLSPRALLANAFEEIAQTDEERKLISEYREQLEKRNADERQLQTLRNEIRKLSFAPGPRDKTKLEDLRKEANALADTVSRADRKLLSLEAAQPLRDALHRAEKVAEDRIQKKRLEDLENIKTSLVKKDLKGKIRKRISSLRKKLKASGVDAVKEEVRPIVETALRAADILFTETLTDEDVLRSGITVDVRDSERKHLDKAVELLKQLDSMGSNSDINDREALRDKLRNQTSYLKELFRIQRSKINSTTVNSVLDDLANVYSALLDSENEYIKSAYREAVLNYIKWTKDEIGGTKIPDMTVEQLEDLLQIYTMVSETVSNTNRYFTEGKKERLDDDGRETISEIAKIKKPTEGRSQLWDKIVSNISWQNLKPVYAMEKIGADPLIRAFREIEKGEKTLYRDIAESRAFMEAVKKKHGFKEWDLKKPMVFTDLHGNDFSLSIEEAMSLYAYSKREQAAPHLEKGGFIFDSSISAIATTKSGREKGKVGKMVYEALKWTVNTQNPTKLNADALEAIGEALTPEQRAYVNEMQRYLSDVMGEKGNKVSMGLFGVKLFKERNYFPLKSAKQFLFEQNEATGEVKLKNSGFAKKLTAKANNPIILKGFDEVWAEHVVEMSNYHAFTLAIEDFNKLYNWQNQQEGLSVKGALKASWGESPERYIKQLITDINGGAITDPRESAMASLISLSKKANVALSMSVVFQQPSAAIRAHALVDTKYFVNVLPKDKELRKKRLKTEWEQLLKYSGAAGIKDIGGFDTGTSRGAAEWVINKKTAKSVTDTITGFLPEWADKVAWVQIWGAVKRETAAKNPTLATSSEEFLTIAGERFSEVAAYTQVYDSILTRSGLMRGKTGLMKMTTAYLGEATTTMNMLGQGARLIKRGKVKEGLRYFSAVYASGIVNAAMAAVVYAARDMDDDETYWEKYLSALSGKLVETFDPSANLFLLRDIRSLLLRYDVERTDISLLADVIADLNKIIRLSGKDTDGMTDAQLAEYEKSVRNAWLSFALNMANVFGQPVKNVYREVQSIMNVAAIVARDLAGNKTSSVNAFVSGLQENIPLWNQIAGDSKTDQLYAALVSGDEAYLKRLEGGYKDADALEQAYVKALKENDPRVRKAAEAKLAGNYSEAVKLKKAVLADGLWTENQVVSAIESVYNKIKPTEEAASGESKQKSLVNPADFAKAVAAGSTDSAASAKSEIIAAKVANGSSQRDAEDSFAQSAKSELLDLYKTDGIMEADLRKALTKWCGLSADDADDAILKADCWKDTGIEYSGIKEAFVSKEITETAAVRMRMQYGGYSQEDAASEVRKWAVERDSGEDYGYDDISDMVLSGDISGKKAKEMFMEYGGYDSEEASEKVAVLEFVREHPECEGISYSAVEGYGELTEDVDAGDWYDVVKFKASAKSDYDESDNVTMSASEKVFDYIDSMDLTEAQKDAIALQLYSEKTVRKLRKW